VLLIRVNSFVGYVHTICFYDMSVLLVIGILLGSAGVACAIDSAASYMYVVSENIHASLCGVSAPRSRRGSTSSSKKWW